MSKKINEIGAGYFKSHCLQIIDEVSNKHTQVIITKHGKPMAKLVPIQGAAVSLFGCLKDSVLIRGDIVNDTGEEWDVDKI